MDWPADDNNGGAFLANVRSQGVKLVNDRRVRKHRDTICQVPGCGCDVSDLKDYHNRFRICEKHQRADSIVLDGIPQRFCQQCGRFQPLPDFDTNRRTCRVKLQQHNERRRISKLVKSCSTAGNPSGSFFRAMPDRKLPDCFDAFASASTDSFDTFENFFKTDQPVLHHASRNAGAANVQALLAAQGDTSQSRQLPNLHSTALQHPQQRKPLSMSSSSSSSSHQHPFHGTNNNSSMSGPSSPPSYSSRSGSPQQTIFSASSACRLSRHGSTNSSGNSSATIPSPNLSISSAFRDTQRSPSPPSSFPFPFPSVHKPALYPQQARLMSPPTNSLRPNPPVLPLSHRASHLPDVDLAPFSFEDVSDPLGMFSTTDFPQDSMFPPMGNTGLMGFPFTTDLQSAVQPNSAVFSALDMLVSSGLYTEHDAEELLVSLGRKVYGRNVEQLSESQLEELVRGMMECGSRQMEMDSSYDMVDGMVPMNTSFDPFGGGFMS